jgi:hypothetical protein
MRPMKARMATIAGSPASDVRQAIVKGMFHRIRGRKRKSSTVPAGR